MLYYLSKKFYITIILILYPKDSDMLRKSYPYFITTLLCFMLTGCTASANAISSISIIYAIITVISLLLAVGYCCLMKSKDLWLLLLYFSVFIVNSGYLCLSISKNLQEALLANRISYLGSAFLPLCMLMTIMNVCKIRRSKITTAILVAISCIMFLIASTPGYLDCYYKVVSLEIVDGVATLEKVYGPLHILYLIYLLTYFALMIGVIVYSIVKKRITSGSHSTILASAVFGNIAVWGIEQIIHFDFEFLSITYIITELFLLMLFVMLQNQQVSTEINLPDISDKTTERDDTPVDGYQYFLDNLINLPVTENKIFNLFVDGKTTKEVMEILNIKENTLKFHNRNIYNKLGVASRKQMLQYAEQRKAETSAGISE